MNNKKVLWLSVVAVVILVIAIVATSYATFTANLTGTKENKIQTGYVKMNCTESTMTVSDTQPMTDAQGIAATGNAATCTLSVTMNGTMKIGYEVGFANVTPSTTLTTSDVKFQASKKVGSTTATVQYLAGTTATTGKTFASIASTAGTTPAANGGPLLSTYAIDTVDNITATQNIYYTIKAWVASEQGGTGSTTTTSNTTAHCSNSTYDNETACENAGEVWGTSQTAEQAGGTFSFKLTISSTQTGV